MNHACEAKAISDLIQRMEANGEKHGVHDWPDGTSRGYKPHEAMVRDMKQRAFAAGQGTWEFILEEEFWEVLSEENPQHLRYELIDLAAVCVAWVEAIDSRNGSSTSLLEPGRPHGGHTEAQDTSPDREG